MRRIVLILSIVSISLITPSCGLMSSLFGYNFDHYNKEYITNYSEKMEVLRSNFPEIYNLYCNGKVVIDEMYYYKTKDGEPKIHIEYHML